MSGSLERWQARHLEAAGHLPPRPSASLIQAFPLFPRPHPRTRALDLACGAGQNAVWLAAHGWPTVAVDFAPAALERAAALAQSRGIPSGFGKLDQLPGRLEGLLLVEADLEAAALPEAAFDLVICFHYLDRKAFPGIERAIAPGGYLLYETFTEAQSEFDVGPHCPDHLLRSGELRRAFAGLETLFYREWCTDRALASLLACKPFPDGPVRAGLKHLPVSP
jgi:SAM-dependent methyltransferase